jgi:hypothetical protein
MHMNPSLGGLVGGIVDRLDRPPQRNTARKIIGIQTEAPKICDRSIGTFTSHHSAAKTRSRGCIVRETPKARFPVPRLGHRMDMAIISGKASH